MAQVGNGASGNLSSATSYGLLVDTLAPSSVTTLYAAVSGKVQTANASFTTPIAASFYAQPASKGASNTITRMLHYYAAAPTAGTNNAWAADNSTFTGSWVFNFTSANASHLSGNLEIVKAGNPTFTLQDSNGALGTNCQAQVVYKDSSTTVAATGFLASTDTVFTFRNYSASGSFQWTVNSTVRGSIDSNGKWTLGETSGGQFHKVNGRGLLVAYGTSGTTGYFELDHSSNTSGSGAAVYLSVAGSNAFDSFIGLAVSSVTDWCLGLDNSDSDSFVISNSSALGSTNALRIATTTCQVTFQGTGGVIVRNDQSASTILQVRNDSTNASAECRIKLSTVDDFNLFAASNAGGNNCGITVNSTFTSFDLSMLGNKIINIRTNSNRRIVITGAGNVVIGGEGSQLSTSATDGFLYIPSCAGTPTGTPTTQAGTVPMIYDTTNNKFYIYNSGWKGGTAPGAFS
jgi:hypothetical protein